MGKKKNPRDYNCKDEELPVLAQYLAFSFGRDLAEFTTFSPKFDAAYATQLQERIAASQQLVAPETESAELGAITSNLYARMQDLLPPTRRLDGYLKLAKNDLPMAVADFGIKALRSGLQRKDTEKVLDALQLINTNLDRHSSLLTPLGLTEDVISAFDTLSVEINQLNQRQYQIVSGRRILIDDNLDVMNELFSQLQEIMTIGKILYTDVDPSRLKEYTFTYLVKQVRRPGKPKAAEATDTSPAEEEPVPGE